MSQDTTEREPRHTNRLADETSPYLLQHAHNPVDWHPWDEEALEKARREDKPILLSIGYSACHWCHVMERESFEDERVAEILNERFVPIKVDREERPDLDDIYMTSVQMMTGQGGWPLNVFLTPDLKPFYGGTYFPPSERMGMPSFTSVLNSVAEAWEQRRDRIEEAGEHLRQKLAEAAETAGGDGAPAPGTEEDEPTLRREPLERALGAARQRFDSAHGGFSQAPKFPHAGTIRLLLRLGARGEDEALHMAVHTLEQMAAGGIYDHLGGGFARYSVDERWLVPHFEKMLYDNAQLATAYVEAYQAAGRGELARVARETLDWVIRDMQGEHGGYFSTLDADSEGEEGRFYVWTREEIEEVLGPEDAHAFALVYDVTDVGNWEGVNILNRIDSSVKQVAAELGEDVDDLQKRLDDARARLLGVRDRRVWPGLDDKVLADWNGLMIAAMARGYRALGDERYLESARRAARFVLDEMTRDGRLLHAWRDGEAKVRAFLDDHADMLVACIELYEASFELEWLERARELADATTELFGESDDGAFYFTGVDHEELLARTRTAHDSSTPSGNGMAATGLLRLETLTGERAYGDRGRRILGTLASRLERQPLAHAQLLLALDYHFRSPTEIVVVGSEDDAATREAVSRLWHRFAPNALIVRHDPRGPDAGRAEAELPVLEGKGAPEAEADGPAFYVCENYACRAPTWDLEEALEALIP